MLGGEIDCSLGGVGLAPDGSWYGVADVVFTLSVPQECTEKPIEEQHVKKDEKCLRGDDQAPCTIKCTDEKTEMTYQCVDGTWTLQSATCPAPPGTMADRVGQGADVVVLVSRS